MEGVKARRYPVTIEGDTVEIGTAGELAVALDILQGQHDRQVLEQLGPHVAEVLGGPAGLMTVTKSLSPGDQIFLFDALGERLGDLLQSARFLRDLLAMLAEPAAEERLLLGLGAAGLRRLIGTAEELAEVLEWVYGRSDQRVLELVGVEWLRHLIADGRALSRVLPSLDEERQAWLLEQLGWDRVRALAASGRDLAYLLRALPGPLSKRLLEQCGREPLIELIGNERDWEFLCCRLEAAELAQLCALLGVDCHA